MTPNPDLHELNELAIEEKNQSIINEVLENLKNLKNLAKKNETKCFLSNESDSLDCYIEIHAGAGGTESQDWADNVKKNVLKVGSFKKF